MLITPWFSKYKLERKQDMSKKQDIMNALKELESYLNRVQQLVIGLSNENVEMRKRLFIENKINKEFIGRVLEVERLTNRTVDSTGKQLTSTHRHYDARIRQLEQHVENALNQLEQRIDETVCTVPTADSMNKRLGALSDHIATLEKRTSESLVVLSVRISGLEQRVYEAANVLQSRTQPDT